MAAKKRSAPASRKRSRTANDAGTSHNKQHSSKTKPSKQERISNQAYSQLKYGSLVLTAAIGLGLVWNRMENADPRVRSFLSLACRTAVCARFVVPTRRTLQAARIIRAGETLVEIPREMQFWDLDALRDDFVKRELLSARHPRSNNHLSGGAFLASWVSLHLQQVVENETEKIDPVRKSYLELLPTVEELLYHPLLWSNEKTIEALGAHSFNYGVVRNYQEMINSEYAALSSVSTKFAGLVDRAAYSTSRINVLTRSFSPGPLGRDELESDDVEEYKAKLGIDFSKGCHAMVPILDLLNHHPNPNVAYNYNNEKRAFVISARSAILPSWELMDSYGKFSDNHLFAKFGFLNGDGSGYTQASIALFHRILDFNMKDEFSHLPHQRGMSEIIAGHQRRDLRRYLQYDDGYTECIQGPETHPKEFELKKLKLEHLVQIANDASHWIVNVPPRSSASLPAESSDFPITESTPEIDPRNLQMDFTRLVQTCRLISVVNSDYDGNAVNVLKDNLGNSSFVVERGNDALDYRALMCLARLTSTALMQYKTTVEEETENVAVLTREAFQSRNWTTAQLRLGEMQTLQALSGIAFSHVRHWDERLPDPKPLEFRVRDQSCPSEYIKALEVTTENLVTM